MTLILVAAALLGLGVMMLIAAAASAAPDLRAAVARLDEPSRASIASPDRLARTHVLEALCAAVAARTGLYRHRADLAITGTTMNRLAAEKLGYLALGLCFPVMLTSLAMIAGLSVPVAVPVGASLVLGVALSFVPEQDLVRRASAARIEMRRTVCAYLELVALERAADAGAVESLERAAGIGASTGFTVIRDALLRARLDGRTPWLQLSQLADELRVAELGDVADIMRLSGEDGAAVLPTLRARAASLRTALLQSDVARANRASERMSIPVALLGVAFMALLGFPAFSRILFG